MVDGYLVDDGFNREYNEIANRVLGPTSGMGASNSFGTQPFGSIYVKITNVVDKVYAEDEPIEFKAKQVHFRLDGTTVDGRFIFDEAVDEGESGGKYNLGASLYGLGIEWDESDIPAADDQWTGLILTASVREIVEADGAGEDAIVTEVYNLWAIDSAPPGEGNGGKFAQCTVTSDLGGGVYSVSVQIGNPLSPNPELKTGKLHFIYATEGGVGIGGQIRAEIYSSEEEGVDFDCFPIETTMNLIAPPPEE